MSDFAHLYYSHEWPWIKEMDGRYYDADRVDERVKALEALLMRIREGMADLGDDFYWRDEIDRLLDNSDIINQKE